MKKVSYKIKKLNNVGTTMMELIITVAIVTVFFGAVAIAVPNCLEQYVMMKNTSEAMEITSIIENGLSTELGGAGRISFTADKGLTYARNGQIRNFPILEDKAGDSSKTSTIKVENKDGVSIMTVTGKPKIYGTLYDTAFYGNMTVEIIVTYKKGADCMNSKITVYNSEGESIAITEKPIVLYNR